MMSIRQLSIGLFIAYLTLLFTGLLLVRWFWFYPIELKVYQKHQQRELHSVHSLLRQHQLRLLGIVRNFAEWDETYEFASAPTDDYGRINFLPESFSTLDIDTVVIINNNGRVLLNKSLDKNTFTLTEKNSELSAWLTSIVKDIDYSSRYPVSFNYINDVLYMTAVTPISSSDGRAPYNGYFAFAQAITPRFWQELEQQTRVRIEPLTPFDMTLCKPMDSPLQTIQDSHVRCLFDLKQQPTMAIRFGNDDTMPRFMRVELYPTFLVISVIPGILFMLFLQLILSPIQHATRRLKDNLALGQIRPLLLNTGRRFNVTELTQLRNAYNDLVIVTRQQQERLELLSNTDRLTNIANRRAFDDALTNTWQRLQRHQQSMVLIMADIDYFKPFNDHYGHAAGDTALQRVAQSLAAAVKRSDELVARYGGEEFVIIAYVNDDIELNQLRLRLASAIHSLQIPHEYSNVRDIITVSFGIAWIKESGPWLSDYQAKDWLKAADAALYQAKGAGRDCAMLHVINQEMPFTTSPEWQQSPN